MKSIFLLILPLITGTEASKEIKICEEGWMEMTWKYPCDEQQYNKLKVILPTKTIQSNQTDKWEKSGKYFFYHNISEKYLRLMIWPLNSTDSGNYGFNCDENTEKSEVKIVEKTNCKKRNQTAYRRAKTTIKCYNPDMSKTICKENNFTCKSIPITGKSGRFTLGDDLHLSISPVSLNDAGVYWCGVKESNGSYRAGISKIQLEVKDITMFPRSRTPGQDLKYYCKYGSDVSKLTKFICKGENPNECQEVGNTTENGGRRRFMMKDNKINQTVTIEVRNVTAADSGTYWCGAENTNKKPRKLFIHMLVLKVDNSATLNAFGDIKKSLIFGTVGVILLLWTTLIIIYKRHSKTKNKERRAADCRPTQEHFYEEVPEHQERLVIAIYANTPTNEPALLPYSIVSFQRS